MKEVVFQDWTFRVDTVKTRAYYAARPQTLEAVVPPELASFLESLYIDPSRPFAWAEGDVCYCFFGSAVSVHGCELDFSGSGFFASAAVYPGHAGDGSVVLECFS